jgi:hypothetical protein
MGWTQRRFQHCRRAVAHGPVSSAFLLGLALAGAALRAADTEYYRHYDPAGVTAMLDYAWTQIAPALEARCDAAGQPWVRRFWGLVTRTTTLSAGRWHRLRDTQLYAGPAGWTTAEHTPGLLLSRARFHDADGNGRWTAAEAVWLDADGDALLSAGEPVLSDPAAAARVGDYGHAFPDRVYAADADADGVWDPGEDVWREPAAAVGSGVELVDLATLHRALTRVLGSYVNPREEPAWDGGTTFARTWTTGSLLAALGQQTRSTTLNFRRWSCPPAATSMVWSGMAGSASTCSGVGRIVRCRSHRSTCSPIVCMSCHREK